MPVLCFGDLCIQFRSVLSKVYTFHIADLFVNIVAGGRAGIIKNVKPNRMSFALQLRHDTIFFFATILNADIVLGDAFQHIDALTYVNDVVIKPNAVDTCMVIFRAVSVPPELSSHIILISVFHAFTSFESYLSFP